MGGRAREDVLRCAEMDVSWPSGTLYPETETMKLSDSLGTLIILFTSTASPFSFMRRHSPHSLSSFLRPRSFTILALPSHTSCFLRHIRIYLNVSVRRLTPIRFYSHTRYALVQLDGCTESFTASNIRRDLFFKLGKTPLLHTPCYVSLRLRTSTKSNPSPPPSVSIQNPVAAYTVYDFTSEDQSAPGQLRRRRVARTTADRLSPQVLSSRLSCPLTSPSCHASSP
ncbi:hypothetical protein FA13DRAFT_1133203 [Coprinellus micaceus]|uniref:Uncharacterized protein n=1 Tax=Coprinellus micaceus TaxID=71717 RepID=A0A4Y7SVJ0_COPMI|nr:hypothetical protein FA13DRAFT_1133203 [Coprinellus micaceus]